MNIERFWNLCDELMPLVNYHDFIIVDRFFLDWAAIGDYLGAGDADIALINTLASLLNVEMFNVHLNIDPQVAIKRIETRSEIRCERENLTALVGMAQSYAKCAGFLNFKVHAFDARRSSHTLAEDLANQLLEKSAP